ncbi:MAG: hypothetical protein JWQ81_5155 [Amycolatopsis sp.]|jgi:hypothetical protein|uniref:hypothetical protein n=1 Tax=Amycolatopsis sp. TaxID=37632 RepID=UPI0026247270|nr:hypothetical protein [Amycolatopsis sp.]MCU1684416.1 hypothetical protein [Amycolatopsis sp.]
MAEDNQQRLENGFAAAGPIKGVATGEGVTVEAGVGGKLLSVKITRQAMRYGADYLAKSIVDTAARATARANQKANQVYAQALGNRSERYTEQLGLSYDPSLVHDNHGEDDFEEMWTRR